MIYYAKSNSNHKYCSPNHLRNADKKHMRNNSHSRGEILKTRFDLDFEFCTSFYKIYQPMLALGWLFIVTRETGTITMLEYTHNNSLFFKITITFSEDKTDIKVSYTSCYNDEKSEVHFMPESLKKRGNNLVTLKKVIHVSSSPEAKMEFPNFYHDDEFLLRLATVFVIRRLDLFSKHYPKIQLPDISQYRCELTQQDIQKLQSAGIKNIPAQITGPTFYSGNKKVDSTQEPAKPKRTCAIL